MREGLSYIMECGKLRASRALVPSWVVPSCVSRLSCVSCPRGFVLSCVVRGSEKKISWVFRGFEKKSRGSEKKSRA